MRVRRKKKRSFRVKQEKWNQTEFKEARLVAAQLDCRLCVVKLGSTSKWFGCNFTRHFPLGVPR